MASYGFSADMDEKFMAIGSHGVFNFEGSVYVHDLNNLSVTHETYVQVHKSNLNTTSYGLLGYSVKFGRFCTERFTDICLAAGAPNKFSFGQVNLLVKNSKNTSTKHIKVQQEINGTEMWSNFGYSLGVISLKNDDYDQLLVGAPLYTEWGNPDHIPDQGVVYQFYYSSDTQNFEKRDTILDGSGQAFARFGSAISNIGDINLDEFPDIAIGAPGENDNAGSIYIYLGSATGLSNSYSQRIQASQELTVEIGVINKAETAYGVTANIEIDTFVLFIRAKSDHSCEPGTISEDVTDINLGKDKTFITCNFFEPLDPTGHLKFNVVFDTDQDNVKKNYLQIKVDVMPKNPAHNPEISQDNNLKIMQKKVFIISDITLASLSSPNDLTKSKSQESEKNSELLNVTHKILVKNQGPSFLPTTKISVAIPFYLKDDVQLVTQADVKMLTQAGEALCKSTSNTEAIIEQSTTTQLTTEQSTKAITTFHFIQSGAEINYWIIIGSIIAGLVLITIIVIVLWKLGFFKRTKHLEVQKMKRESMRRSMKEGSKSPADE
ncbi:Integrin alpha-4 [Bulinus truncatus]|nr:Integrin alpha-4 [Bulinus truncatus]